MNKQIESLYQNTVIKQCISEIEKDKDLISSKSSCGMLLLDNGEEVQVQISIVREQSEFLGDFEIVNYTEYKGGNNV